jgi:hypothetical protein
MTDSGAGADPDDAPSDHLHDYLLDRLAACGLPARYYAWVDALAPHSRGLSSLAGEDYTLTGEDMKAAWEAAGLKATGSGKSRTGTLVHGDLRFTSTLLSPRGSNIMTLTVNLARGGDLVGSDFAVLAAQLLTRGDQQLPDPPYPRASAMSAGDVHWYAARVAELLRDLAAACDAAPPPA